MVNNHLRLRPRLFSCIIASCYRWRDVAVISPCDAFSPRTQRGRRAVASEPSFPQTQQVLTQGRSTVRWRILHSGGVYRIRPPFPAVSEAETEPSTRDDRDGRKIAEDDADSPAWIIQWRGEGTEGYSEALRELEFASAFRAEAADYLAFRGAVAEPSPELKRFVDDLRFDFQDALTFSGPVYDPSSEDGGAHEGGLEPIPWSQVKTYESAMQYVTISPWPGTEASNSDGIVLPTAGMAMGRNAFDVILRSSVRRCSLVRTAFQIISMGSGYEELAAAALANGSFEDLMEGGVNEGATWAIRLRRYGEVGGALSKRNARFGKSARSPLRDERGAILSMADLVKLFRGKVDLAKPECKIYLLEGLRRYDTLHSSEAGSRGLDKNGRLEKNETLLARVIAKGPKTSIYAPKMRICVTTTPLCPIASFALCNAARLQRHGMPAVLDPFAGSCATLLAAAHITSLRESNSTLRGPSLNGSRGCRSVAIEIAHNGFVNRDDIVRDFAARSLPPPSEIIRGDCLSPEARDRARWAIGGGAFDAIVTDPPYGIREAMGAEGAEGGGEDASGASPLERLFCGMGEDRSRGVPLLKSGGRLAAFIPVRRGQRLEDCLPGMNARKAAGLVMDGEGREQVLSNILSRWLVSFICT